MKKLAAIAASTIVLGALLAPAFALEFAPKAKFTLTNTKVKGNPSINIAVNQEKGQAELAHVTLSIPKGFKLPADKAIAGGTQIGTADIQIGAGPGCAAGQPDLAAPLPLSGNPITELDRSDEQADRGVVAVWRVDLRGVTRIDLEITGSTKKGYKLDGDIPANPFTCPPIGFDAVINDKAGDVKILQNPAKAGKYVFMAQFTSQETSEVVTIKQPIKIK